MKLQSKITYLFSLLLIAISFSGQSQTNISGSINGTQTWTTSGSPYMIQSNLYINGSLIIQPGVEVLVEGPYKIKVIGSLQAIGTASQPILFASDDTTGFHSPNTYDGGWHGLAFNYYTVPNPSDISEFEYCIVRDVKLVYAAPPQSAAIYSQRGMEVKNCEFYHNWCSGGEGATVRITTTANQRNALVQNSYFHDNITWMASIRMNYNNSGMGQVQDCTFENNEGGIAILAYEFPDIKIERNEIDNNSSTKSSGMITTQNCSGRIGDNRVTHNDIFEQGALRCINGVLLIEKNLICNNHSYAEPLVCGITEGGGGLHLSGNSTQPENLKKHTVRDNIIANNSSGTWGGGMYINDIDAWVYNNTIINNSCYYNGSSIYNRGSKHSYIHNNIFTGNISTFAMGATNNHVSVSSTVHVAYDYNFGFHDFASSLAYSGSNFIGDSTHCISGVTAGLVNPTTSALITQDASNKDFRLLQTSPCINAGTIDTLVLNSIVDSFDFGYEIRVSGDSIDIGAHEFPLCKDTIVVDSYTTCGSFTWIDGNTYTANNNSASVTFDRLDNCGDS
ncbi:MAG: choice-of-anchor Q domain-containing protein, partial [Bacteroidota bacterium]